MEQLKRTINMLSGSTAVTVLLASEISIRSACAVLQSEKSNISMT